MKELTDGDLKKLATQIINQEPYKKEFATPYYRSVTLKMLVEAMKIALAAAKDE